MERAIDVHISAGNWNGLFRLIAAAVLLNILMILGVKLRMWIMAKLCNSILVTIRQDLYTHIQTLDFSFFDSRPTGKILARIIGDINSLKDVLGNCVTTLIPDFITICAVVGIMFAKDPILAAASLISLPLMIVSIWFIQVYSHKRWQAHRKKSSNLNAFVHEDLSGIRIIPVSYTHLDVYKRQPDVRHKCRPQPFSHFRRRQRRQAGAVRNPR